MTLFETEVTTTLKTDLGRDRQRLARPEGAVAQGGDQLRRG